jgi:hypothetical protein
VNQPGPADAGATPASRQTSESEPQQRGGFFAERARKAADREGFERLARAAASGDDGALQALPQALGQARQNWRASKLDSTLWEILKEAVRQAIADDVLTSQEEDRLFALATAMGLDMQGLRDHNFELFEEVVVAGINSGRLPSMPAAPMLLKRGEIAYGSFGCELMKEVTLREFRGGSQGVSIPLGAGVRYRVGAFRGHSVVVGTNLVAEDHGVLCVTSTRSVFAGQKKTLEFRHDRLVGVQQYTDGLRMNVTNRQAASLFRMFQGESPMIAAALVTAAVSASQSN